MITTEELNRLLKRSDEIRQEILVIAGEGTDRASGPLPLAPRTCSAPAKMISEDTLAAAMAETDRVYESRVVREAFQYLLAVIEAGESEEVPNAEVSHGGEKETNQ